MRTERDGSRWKTGARALAGACLVMAAGYAVAGTANATREAAAWEGRVEQAVLMALTNNRALSVQRLNPAIRRTYEETERAAFDTVAEGGAAYTRLHPSGASPTGEMADVTSASLGLARQLPTGTRIRAGLEVARDSHDALPYGARAGVDITQPLLRGMPVAVNLVRLRQAELATEISVYELRGFAETLVAAVESAYWECALARRREDIVERSLALAGQQLGEIQQRIKVGNLAETELAAAEAEVALRREALINAHSSRATADLRLWRLISPGALAGVRRNLALTSEPVAPDVALGPVQDRVADALQRRPDLNQARLKARSGDLELVRTRNGLLPKMDLFAGLGDTGYARSFRDSVSEIDGDEVEASAGVRFEFPVRNREARALHRRANHTREQLEESLRNLEDLVRVDVEAGYLEAERTREQVAATATTRRLQEEKLRAETVKFNVGRSTALLVAQAQRDLLSSQVAEVDAVVRRLQALVEFCRLEGTLLERRGVAVEGEGGESEE